MIDLELLHNYEVSLNHFQTHINELDFSSYSLQDEINDLTQNVFTQGQYILHEISNNEVVDLSVNQNNLDISVNLYDHRLNHLSEILNLKELSNARNKHQSQSSTYTFFVIWFFILMLFIFIFCVYIVEDSLNLNIFTKPIIGILLIVVFYFLFHNIYRVLSRNS